MNRRGGLVVHAPRLRRRLDLGLGLLVVVAEARVFDVLGGDATRATRGALLRGNLLRGRSLALLVAGASRTLGGVGGRGVDGASDLGGDSMVRPGRGTAQVRGVLHDERFEGELRGKIHPTRHLELFKVRLVEAEPLEVHNEHPRQPHDLPRAPRVSQSHPPFSHLRLQRLGREEPGQQRGEIAWTFPRPRGARRRGGGTSRGACTRPRTPRTSTSRPTAVVKFLRVGHKVLCRGTILSMFLDVSGPGILFSTSRPRSYAAVTSSSRASRTLAQELVRVVLLVTHVVRVPALHRGLHLRG